MVKEKEKEKEKQSLVNPAIQLRRIVWRIWK
jgi:hypothetical protein